jgi:hypothetical protein
VTQDLLGREGAQQTLMADLKELATASGRANFDGQVYLQDYGMDLLPYSAPAIALFALALLVCPCFFVARCCCASRCCNSHGPFSKTQIWLPLVFYMIFSTVAMGLAFASVYQVGSFVDGVVGGACELEGLVGDSSNLLTTLDTPMANLAATVSSLQTATETRFTTRSDIVAHSRTLLTELDALVAIIEAGDASAEADVYVNIDTRVAVIKAELNGGLLPLIVALDAIRVGTIEALGQAATGLNQVASAASTAIDGLATDAQTTIDPILDSTKDAIGKYSVNATSISYYFYSIVFVAFGAGILVFITAMTPTKCDDMLGYGIFTCSWTLTYVFMLLMFLLSGVLLPLSLVSSDVCAVIGDIPQDVDTWVLVTESFDSVVENEAQRAMRRLQEDNNLETVSAIIKGCFATPPVPLTRSLNLTDAIDLEAYYADFEAGELPSIDNATTVISFEDTVNDFANNPSAQSPSFQPTMEVAQEKLGEIDTLLIEVTAAAQVMYANTGESLNDIVVVADEVRGFDDFGSCGFLSQRYNNLVDEVCDGSVAAVSNLSFYGFAIGVCGIPMLITSVLISNRIFHYEELPMANYFAPHDDEIQIKDDFDSGSGVHMADMDYDTLNPKLDSSL